MRLFSDYNKSHDQPIINLFQSFGYSCRKIFFLKSVTIKIIALCFIY